MTGNSIVRSFLRCSGMHWYIPKQSLQLRNSGIEMASSPSATNNAHRVLVSIDTEPAGSQKVVLPQNCRIAY